MITLDPRETEAAAPPGGGNKKKSSCSCLTIFLVMLGISITLRLLLFAFGHFSSITRNRYRSGKRPRPGTAGTAPRSTRTAITANPNERKRLEECKKNLKVISGAIKLYANDNQGLSPDNLDKLTPRYLKAIPTCPEARRDTYSSSYRVARDYHRYTIFCRGRNHKKLKVAPDNPRFSSKGGFDVRSRR